MREDPTVVLLSIIVIVAAIASLGVGFVWSIPYAIGRMRRYQVPGSAKRLFAQFTLSNIALPIFCMIAFLAVGVVTFVIDPGAIRVEVVRGLIILAVVATATQIVTAPIGHRYIENAAEREYREADDTTIREIASETLSGVQEVREAVREVQAAAEIVRTQLQHHEAEVKDQLEERVQDVKDAAAEVKDRLEEHNAEVKYQLDTHNEARVTPDENRDAKQKEDLQLSQDISDEQDRVRDVQDTTMREIATETLAGVREVQESAEIVRTKLKEHDESRVALDEGRDAKQGEDLRLSQDIVNEQERIRDMEEK